VIDDFCNESGPQIEYRLIKEVCAFTDDRLRVLNLNSCDYPPRRVSNRLTSGCHGTGSVLRRARQPVDDRRARGAEIGILGIAAQRQKLPAARALLAVRRFGFHRERRTGFKAEQRRDAEGFAQAVAERAQRRLAIRRDAHARIGFDRRPIRRCRNLRTQIFERLPDRQ